MKRIEAKNVKSVNGKPYARKEYILRISGSWIRKFETGIKRWKCDAKITFQTNERVKIRDNALEEITYGCFW